MSHKQASSTCSGSSAWDIPVRELPDRAEEIWPVKPPRKQAASSPEPARDPDAHRDQALPTDAAAEITTGGA